MDKAGRIKKELKRLNEIYRSTPEGHKATLEGLIKNTAWLRVTIEDAQADIDLNGSTEKFQQAKGMEPYDRKRPIADQLDKWNSQYRNNIKILVEHVPEQDAKDELEEFLKQ